MSRSFDFGDLREFLKTVFSKEKDETYFGFLVNIFTNNVHLGGVGSRSFNPALQFLFFEGCRGHLLDMFTFWYNKTVDDIFQTRS